MPRCSEIETIAELLAFARAQGKARLRRQLRALPRRGRRRRQGLSQSQRRSLAVGRHARRHRRTRSRHGVALGNDPGRACRQMPAFGRDGMLKRRRDIERSPIMCARSPACRSTPSADLARRQETLRRQLRRLPRRRRQGQPRVRRAQPDRRDLALWLRQGDHRRRPENGRGGVMPAWGGRLDAGDDQGAGRLCPHARRRREIAPDGIADRPSSVESPAARMRGRSRSRPKA